MVDSGSLRSGLISTLHRTAAIAAMVVAATLLGATVAPAAESESIFMRTGSDTTLKAAFAIASMAAENAGVVAVTPPKDADKTKVVLTAKAAGATTVTLSGEAAGATATYNIVVLNLLPDDVRELVKSIPGLEVKAISTGVIVQGVVFNKKDKDQIDAICAQRAHDIFDLVEYNPVHPVLLKRIKDWINMPAVEVKPSSDTVVLAGYVPNEEAKKRAEDLAKSLADKVLNVIIVQPQQIELDCEFISADKRWREELGVNLLGNAIQISGAVTSRVGPDKGQSSFLNNTSYSVTALGGVVVQCLEANERNKVLCKPHLTVVSGRPAEVASGGQIGIRLPGDVKYLPYGLSMKILPVLDVESNVQSDVVFELSSVPTRSNEGYGDISNTIFRVTTTMRCKLGETIICSGIKDTRSDTVDERTPILGYIPLICYLGFRHKETVERENEILVCITPSLSTTISMPDASKRGTEDSKKLLQQGQSKE